MSFLRVLLVNPYNYGHPHLGLASIAAYLKDKLQCTVSYLEIEKQEESDSYLGRIATLEFDIIGVSAISTKDFPDVMRKIRRIKGAFPSIPLVAGGSHVTSNPGEVLAHPEIDYVVVGEGEVTLLELLLQLGERRAFNRVQGLGYKELGGPIINEGRPFIEDLDSLPRPDYSLFDFHKYASQQVGRTSYAMRRPVGVVVTSRGCPMNCIYCSIKKIWRGTWRMRSAESVVSEIEHLKSDYGINEIHFLDDNFSADKKRTLRICELLIERKVDISWTTPNGIAIWTLDEHMIDVMKQSGCYRLTFGLESGDDGTKRFIRKNYSIDRAKELIRYCSRRGIWTIGTFIIGFPYEGGEAVENTIKFACATHLDGAAFYIATPFPGTELYEIYRKEGLNLPSSASLFNGVTESVYFSAKELKRLKLRAHQRFYYSRLCRAYTLWWKIRSVSDLRYLLRICRNIARAYANGFRSFFA